MISRWARLLKPAGPADISAAQADLKKAIADKATLLRPPPPPTQAQVDAATQAVNLAQQKLDRLNGPPDPIAVQQALQDEMTAISAHADLEEQKPPASPLALAAAQAVIETASMKVQKLRGPISPSKRPIRKFRRRRSQSGLRERNNLRHCKRPAAGSEAGGGGADGPQAGGGSIPGFNGVRVSRGTLTKVAVPKNGGIWAESRA